MNLYEILGCETTATQEEIKKAYKVKAMKYHPDRGGDIDRFKALQQAYEILSDEQSREHYDTTGKIGKTQPYDPTGDAIAVFSKVVERYSNAISTTDLIDAAIVEVRVIKQAHSFNIQGIEHEITLKQNLIDRITRKEGHNFIAATLQASIVALTEQKEQLEDTLVKLDKVRDVLETFEYRFDPAEQQIYTGINTGTTFNGFTTTRTFFS